jgi:hypothetical protein
VIGRPAGTSGGDVQLMGVHLMHGIAGEHPGMEGFMSE